MNKKWSASLIIGTVLVCIAIFLLGFKKDIKTDIPKTLYRVYLNGEVLGLIKSENDFLTYINTKQNILKNKYGVDTIYAPKGVEVKKIVTYENNILSNEEVYNKLINVSPFTIKGVVINIENKEDNKKYKINVLNKNIFDEALIKTIKAFVGEVNYNNYINGTQAEIVDVGAIIEDVDKQEIITYQDNLIATDEIIFMDVDELAKYLLYGSLDNQDVYTVQEGDTIENVAFANKINVQEFLIANPSFTSANNLLYANQRVNVGLIKPIINIVTVEHVVEQQDKLFVTEIQYDDTKVIGYEQEVRAGENGLYQVTKKNRYVNGQLLEAVPITSTELKPSVSRILVKGSKYIPDVADLSYWAWPTDTPYSITSGYGWRWGEFHAAIDIIASGYGSPIYAANNGVVYKVGYDPKWNGNYVYIRHNVNGYYTTYLHMKEIYVVEGQTVARGQRIGAMGNTGYVLPRPSTYCPTCGTHLHFGFFVGAPDLGGSHRSPWVLY